MSIEVSGYHLLLCGLIDYRKQILLPVSAVILPVATIFNSDTEVETSRQVGKDLADSGED